MEECWEYKRGKREHGAREPRQNWEAGAGEDRGFKRLPPLPSPSSPPPRHRHHSAGDRKGRTGLLKNGFFYS